MELSTVLTKSFCDRFGINPDTPYSFEFINPKDLIVPERIDLLAKLKYIEHREKGLDLSFVKSVYTAHIEAWSDGQYHKLEIKKSAVLIHFSKFLTTLSTTLKKMVLTMIFR